MQKKKHLLIYVTMFALFVLTIIHNEKKQLVASHNFGEEEVLVIFFQNNPKISDLSHTVGKYHTVNLQIQLNLNGSNTFGTMKTSSRQGISSQ